MSKLLKKGFIIFSVFLIINYISYGFIICLVNVIELDEINKPNIIEFYDKDENLIYTLNTEYEGEYILYENINPLLIDSFINLIAFSSFSLLIAVCIIINLSNF